MGETKVYKNLQFVTILLCYKKCVIEKRTYVNKGGNLLRPYVLMVLLSIPFNFPAFAQNRWKKTDGERQQNIKLYQFVLSSYSHRLSSSHVMNEPCQLFLKVHTTGTGLTSVLIQGISWQNDRFQTPIGTNSDIDFLHF